MHSVTITIKLSPDLLEDINEAAKYHYASRSDYIRQTLALRLNSQQIVNKR